jgi:hypothetical protein
MAVEWLRIGEKFNRTKISIRLMLSHNVDCIACGLMKGFKVDLISIQLITDSAVRLNVNIFINDTGSRLRSST